MLAGQKLVAEDGKEVMLFPLSYMYMSQDEGGDLSHVGTYCMDFLGWGASGRIFACDYYAPCTCRLYSSTYGDGNMMIWESVDEVHLPDGTLSKVCWQVAHDNNPPYRTPGTIIEQGDLMGHTGTYGYVTGDHVHFNVARGSFAGGEYVPPNNNWQFKNSIHIYDACYVNDTVIVQGYGHKWQEFTGGITPTGIKKHKFPWAVYFNRFRNNRINV